MANENPYIKQFPDLMAGKKIMYVHGFCSSGQSGTVKRLPMLLPNTEVVAPDVPLQPEEALPFLQDFAQREQPDLIMGTSMGGMYTEMLRGFDRICVNPAFRMGHTMKDHGMMGKQTYFNPRRDGVQEFIVTKDLVKSFREMTENCFQGMLPEDQQRVFGLFGMEDPLVDTYDLFCEHYSQAIRYHGEHQLTDSITLHSVIPVIRWIDDRQEGREREILYLGLEAMQDERGEARPSSLKGLSLLIEKYDVYLVAPSPVEVNNTALWVEDKLGVPLWNRVICCNDRRLLYGDFLVARQDCPGFLGTTLIHGSDTFRTWDELVEYFSRL